MSFLDEKTVTTDDEQKAATLAKQGVDVKLVDKVDEKRAQDHDGDGDIDSADYLAARDKAIKKAMGKKVEEGKGSKFLGALGIAASLLAVGQINKSDSVLKAIDAKIEQADTKAEKAALQKLADQRLRWLDTGKGPGGDIKASDVGDVLKELAEKTCGCGQTPCKTYGKMQEKKDKTVELPADTTFTLDLKHLMKKHMNEGKSQEDVVKLTKALMKKLHDKGEVTVKGTKVIFKEADVPQDTQLTLPEPDAPDFLGSDGMDYEGGMAKSQMLKMKNYAKALCDMIDDESQLEAWVQAKLTKASDYMSSVYHYLDYQQTKNLNEAFELNGREVVDLETDGGYNGIDPFISTAYYLDTGEELTPEEIEDLINKYPADLELGGTWWDWKR